MGFCGSCGNKIDGANAQYCNSCGIALSNSGKKKERDKHEIFKHKSINPLHSVAYLILFIGIFAFIWAFLFQSDEGPKNVIPTSITFYTLDWHFGSGSELTEMQKDIKWNEFEGYYVKWTGTVKTVGTTFGDPYVGLKIKESTWTYDVNITFRDEYIKRLSYLNKGDKITVIGKIIRGGGNLLAISLVDGRLTN